MNFLVAFLLVLTCIINYLSIHLTNFLLHLIYQGQFYYAGLLINLKNVCYLIFDLSFTAAIDIHICSKEMVKQV